MAKVNKDQSNKVKGIISAPDRFTAVTGMQQAKASGSKGVSKPIATIKRTVAKVKEPMGVKKTMVSTVAKIKKPSGMDMNMLKEVIVKGRALNRDSATIDGQKVALTDAEKARAKVSYAGNTLKGSLALKNPKERVKAVTSEFAGERSGDSGSPLSAIKSELKKMGKLK
jgi:fructose-specific component phosphotransferase system IIB-like protein